jgi:hypothetical protein
LSSLLRFQQEQIKKEQEKQKINVTENQTIIKQYASHIFLTIFILWFLLSFILFMYLNFEYELLLIINILIISGLTIFWLRNKYRMQEKKLGSKNSSIPKTTYISMLLIFNIFFGFTWLYTFSYFIIDLEIEMSFLLLYGICISLFIITLSLDIYMLVSFIERDSIFFLDFLKKSVRRWDPKKENTLMNFLALIGVFILFPMIFFSFIFQNLELALLVLVGSLSILFLGYWFGYGIYRSYRWVQGFDPNLKISTINQFGLKTFSAIIYSILGSIWIFFLAAIILLVFFNLLEVSTEFSVILFVVTLTVFMSQLLKLDPNAPSSSESYSNRFNILVFSLIPLFTPPYFIMISKKANSYQSIYSTTNFELLHLSFVLLFVFAGLITYFTYRNKLKFAIWNDKFEGNQLLTEINLSLHDPKIVHLNLLAKLGLSQSDPSVTLKLLSMYSNLLNQKKVRTEFLETMHFFLLHQIENTSEWRIHAVVFDLINQFLEYEPKYYKEYYNKAEILVKHKDEFVRQASLNLLGHILHIDSSYADSIFPIIIDVYSSSSDELKKHHIEPLKYYARNFPEYRNKLYKFVEEKIEKEFFGVSTELMSIIEELAQTNEDYFQKSMDLGKKILQKPDSKGGLGAVRILVNNFPDNPKDGVPILKILTEYLKDGLPEVKFHIVYSLGTIIAQIPELTSILQDIDFAVHDDDPNVRSALIQVITDIYPHGNIPEDVLLSYLQYGINDEDYVVRLLSIQRISGLLDQISSLSKNLPIYLEKALKDSNSDVFEEAYNLFQKKHNFLLENFPKWVENIGIVIEDSNET